MALSATSLTVVQRAEAASAPVTTLAINGIRYLDSATGKTFVSSESHFNLSVDSTSTKGTYTYYRYYKSSLTTPPAYTKGIYFQISGSNGEYIVQFYSTNIGGSTETVNEQKVTLDNTAPTATYSSSTKKITATDNSGGSGVGIHANSGIYYKLDSATSYKYVQSSSFDVSTITTTWNTIYFYAEDNVQNPGAITSAAASTSYTYTFCSSGCTYSSLQTAINALPSGGGSILIKDGQYKWSNTISLKSGTSLVFSSGAYITFTGSSKDVFSGSGVSNVSIKGGSITAQYSGVKAIAFYSSKGIHVDGTKMQLVQGSNSNAFYCSDCIDVFVSNINANTATRLIDIKTSTRDASSGLSSNIWLQNNVVANSSIEGIKVNWCKDVHIIGNKITNTQENGIDIGFNINSEVDSNTLIKTGMNDAAGIHPDGTNTATISNNYIETTGSTAIPVYRTTKVNVLDNTIKYSGAEGISIIDSKDTTSYTTVKNNWVYAPSIQGIYESPDQYQVVIAYNTLENIPSGYKAVLVISPNPTTSVYGNTVK